MNIIFASLFLLQMKEELYIEEKIKFLNPNVKQNYLVIMKNVLNKYYFESKIDKRDVDILISMSYIESSFENIDGSCGEVGILQVIPEDRHIQEFLLLIVGEKVSKDLRWKIRNFLKNNVHISFEIGVMEYIYWKEQYKTKYKNLYWSRFPEYEYKKKDPDFSANKKRYKNQWDKMIEYWGEYIFIAHYNWGGRYLISPTAWGYLGRVKNVVEKIKNMIIRYGEEI